jgi:hypothetical protein
MIRPFQFLHRRSLTVCFVALFFGFVAFGFLPEFVQRLKWRGTTFLVQAGGAAIMALVVCMVALVNLVRDVERGYSPSRCSLAAVVLLFAFAPIAFLMYQVIRHLGDLR